MGLAAQQAHRTVVTAVLLRSPCSYVTVSGERKLKDETD